LILSVSGGEYDCFIHIFQKSTEATDTDAEAGIVFTTTTGEFDLGGVLSGRCIWLHGGLGFERLICYVADAWL
jgi:hypothetical protein